MQFTCRHCGGGILVDPEKLRVSPRVQCPSCGHLFRLREQPVREPSTPAPNQPVTVYAPPIRPVVATTTPLTVVTVEASRPLLATAPPTIENSPRPQRPWGTLGLLALVVLGFSGWLWTALRPARTAPPAAVAQEPVAPLVERPTVVAKDGTEKNGAEKDVAAGRPALDTGPWMRADFVLVNPTHYAVALSERDTPARFQVLAKAEEGAARSAVKTAWDSAVPIVAGDPKLARNVYARSQVNQEVPVELRPELEAHWRHHEFVPPDATLVAYNDLARGQRRVGFRRAGGEGLEFRELLGQRFERVPLELVQPGTLEENLDDERLATGTDFIDVCLYQICRKLASPEHQSSYLQVIVNGVLAESEDLKYLEAHLTKLNQQLDDLTRDRAVVDQRSRKSGQEDERPDLGRRQRELEARKHELERQRELTLEARRLTGELRAKLSQLEVFVVGRKQFA